MCFSNAMSMLVLFGLAQGRECRKGLAFDIATRFTLVIVIATIASPTKLTHRFIFGVCGYSLEFAARFLLLHFVSRCLSFVIGDSVSK
jgi:hypothetical protein